MTSDDSNRAPALTRRLISNFLKDRDGAVTVDWVALTAFTVFLGMGAAFYIASSAPRVANKVGDHLSATTVMPN